MSASKNLGKVFMTPKGIWDKTLNYTKLDIVTNKVGKISCGYIAMTDIEKNVEITDNRWLKLFELIDGDLTEEYKAVQTDVTNKATDVDANKKAVDLIYSQMQKLYDVEISTTTPTNERTGLWINPDDISGVINIPEIKDDEVSDVDTWSSKKIDNVTNSLKCDFENHISNHPSGDGSGGVNGKDGVGISSVEQTTISTDDGGINVVTVTKTDGTTSNFQIRNGSKGNKGDTGEKGETGPQGPAGSDYVLTDSDKEEIVSMFNVDVEGEVASQLDGAKANIVTELIEQIGGMPIFGTVNDDNTITVTSTLANGNYVLMYENEDGTFSEVGTITVENKEITITYTNLVPTSVTNDGVTIYGDDYDGDGTADGYRNNVRLRTDGIEEAELANQFATGFTSVTIGDVIRIKGATYNDLYTKLVGYNSDFTERYDYFYSESAWKASNFWTVTEENDGVVAFTLKVDYLKWVRFTGVGDGADFIMTKNEEII